MTTESDSWDRDIRDATRRDRRRELDRMLVDMEFNAVDEWLSQWWRIALDVFDARSNRLEREKFGEIDRRRKA